MKVTRVVVYSCRHTRTFEEEFAPQAGEFIWCPRCRKEVMITNTVPEYRMRCRKCKYSKAYGTAKIDAEMAIVNHRKGKPEHIVDLFNGKIVVRTFGDYGQRTIAA